MNAFLNLNTFIIVVLECEENICENGGNCTRHINDLTCDCLPGSTGFLCEETGMQNVTL